MSSPVINRFDQAAQLISLADQYASDVNSSYDFDLQRSANEVLSLAEIDKNQLSETEIRERVEVLDDLIFNFIPNLISTATNSFSELIAFGLVSRDLDRNSQGAVKTLKLFEDFSPEALKHGQAALDLLDSKMSKDVHDPNSSKNGLGIMHKRVRNGSFSLMYPYPNIRNSVFDEGLKAFRKLRQAFTTLHDFSDSKMYAYSTWLTNSHRSKESDLKFMNMDYFEVFRKTTEGLAQVYDFVANLKDQLPEDLKLRLIDTLKKSTLSDAANALKINGAYVFRIVTDPNKVFPKSTTSNDPVARCPHSMSRPEARRDQSHPKQQRP